MAFTDNCDLYAAVHEEGVNRVINHIMRQRPSLFNYGSADVATNPEMWCAKVVFTDDVKKYDNPVFTVMPPLPVIGSASPEVQIGFSAQLTNARIDFHPGNVVSLPGELSPPLKDQKFALQFRVCGSIECPSDRDLSQVPIGQQQQPAAATFVAPPPPPVILRGQLNCFCLDVFVVGGYGFAPGNVLVGHVDGIEIVDIKPDGLEQNLECYIKTAVNVVFRQRLPIAMEALSLSFPLFNLATVTLMPTPNPPVPHNPAIEEDQLKVFITMKVA